MESTNCWYYKACEFSGEDCDKDCIRYMEMKYLMEHSNIPKNRQMPVKLSAPSCDRKAFEELATIRSNIDDFVELGNNLYICGASTGNGKTTWAIKLMLRYFHNNWAGNGFRPRALFIHVPTFLMKCKDFGNRDEAFEEMKRLIMDIDLVVWDDIASAEISNYDYSQLLMYIDARTSNGRSNIYTGNVVSFDSMTQVLGAKLTSRIMANSTKIIEFRGGDMR